MDMSVNDFDLELVGGEQVCRLRGSLHRKEHQVWRQFGVGVRSTCRRRGWWPAIRGSLPGAASEVETVEVPEHTVDSDPITMERRLCAAGAFASLDAVDLHEVFELRARVMCSVPAVLRGVPSSNQDLDVQEIERS